MKSSQGENKMLIAEKYFRRYLKIAPLSVALCRSVEAKYFSTIRIRCTFKTACLFRFLLSKEEKG